MAKMNIYVPDDLKRRMDAVEGESWSPLACRAFEARLAEIITVKGAKNMQDIVTRLRASKQQAASGDKRAGHEAGAEWAKSSAEAPELERLEELASEPEYGISGLWVGSSAYGPDEHFVFTIQPDSDGNRAAAQSFWDENVGEDVKITEDFLEGFADGALAVWNNVKDQL